MLVSAKARPSPVQRDRYSTVAIVLHWTIAAVLVLQLALGWRMNDIEGLGRSVLLQLHKSIGITILLLTAARLIWRLRNPPPPVHSSLTTLERHASHWVHVGFYTALLALPLTGWAMVSTRLTGGMKLFGLIPWPNVPLLTSLPGDLQDILSDVFSKSHELLVWMTLALVALHVAGALKHHFISRDPTVSRMAPGLTPGAVLDPRLLAIPAGVVVLAAAAYLAPAPDRPPRPKVTNLAKADVYLDLVGPVLDRRCGFCHNDDDARGGLSLTSAAAIRQGGRGGPVIVPGDPAKSPLFRRVNLPVDNPKYMPKDGKPPLTKNEMALIGWWISQGAPSSTTVGSLKLTPAVTTAIKAILGGGGDEAVAGGPREAPLPVVAPADQAQVDKLVSQGFILRKAKASSNLLVAEYISPKPLSDAAITDLIKLSPQIFELNLRHAGVTDAQVKTIAGAFPHLDSLRLEDNAVTDAAANAVVALGSLTYLNLDATKITDTGFEAVAKLPNLKRLYVWDTAVSPAAIGRVKASRKDVILYAGLTAKDVPVNTKVVQPANN